MRTLINLVVSILCMTILPMTVHANEIFSCKAITQATVKSDDAYGTALYGDSASDRRYMSLVKPKVLLMQHQKSLQLGDFDYQYLGQSGAQYYYADSYFGLVEVYDRKKNEVTLFVSRTNGDGEQRSNFMEVKLWHCNK